MMSREEAAKLYLALADLALVAVRDCGRALADLSEHGLIISGGQRSEAGRRYTVVVATNDAADALAEWARREVDGRADAMRAIGLNPIVRGAGVAKPDGGKP